MSTDERLALNAQLGNENALANLIERHYDALVGYLYRSLGGDQALAHDLVQETFVNMMRSLRQYEYPRPFKAWLYTIATNLVRNHFRRPNRQQSLDAQSPQEVVDTGPTLDEMVSSTDEVRLLVRRLTALPEHQREVVILRYYEELSLAEIAEILSIPIGTVKSRLSIGLSRLRALMEEATI